MCTPIRHPFVDAETNFSPVRALRSLTESDVNALTTALVGVSGSTWSLERHEGYDGHLSLLLTPAGEASEPGFSLSRDRAGLRLFAWHGDEHTDLGAFADVRAVAGAVQVTAAGTMSETPAAA